MSDKSIAISEGVEREGSENGSSNSGRIVNYSGWAYHLGVNSIGHEYCHLRYLTLKGKYITMYKRDPEKDRGIVRSPTLCLNFLGLNIAFSIKIVSDILPKIFLGTDGYLSILEQFGEQKCCATPRNLNLANESQRKFDMYIGMDNTVFDLVKLLKI